MINSHGEMFSVAQCGFVSFASVGVNCHLGIKVKKLLCAGNTFIQQK